MSQETPPPNRIQLLRTQLWAWAGETGYREAVRIGAPRSREAVPVVDLVHEEPPVALATLLGLLEQDRFEAPVLLIERGLDRAGTPFLHHENATAALGAACAALHARRIAGAGTGPELLGDLLGVWLIGAVADFPEAHEAYLRDLARGMGPAMVPQGWAGTLLHASPAASDARESLVVNLIHEAVVERAPGATLRTVGHALSVLDAAGEADHAVAWRRALAFVIGAELHHHPAGRLYSEYHAHLEAPASRHRRAVLFIQQEAIPAYHSVGD
ncbi:MAG: hypothetical protein LLP51_09520 [Halorhodospira halophila]|uniref:hypothetical protein n=1 Tax=Halorhodospira TaxID=85108 RepID=UPI001911BDB4|nr:MULTISPECIES: hypothetical protein [Halorhodospira]MBK5944573.1 hypothetical protein [Halorhodospira halophila]MCC3751621.1 hypothetical protein [Halorhodospira halophila]MCG5527282.1 hypothetical protein [Halorhodospira halophila]MCG5532491.1 hypothetical protein [Halorhodospira sp. 9621]MCG5538151.1 hypothetical protein [Halorhodospira sp. 9622]